MISILNKYKFQEGVASSIVNSMANDFLQLYNSNQPLSSNFDAYTKIVSSDHLQEVFFEKTNPSYIQPIMHDSLQVVDRSYNLKFSTTPLLPIITRALRNQSLVDYLWNESTQRPPQNLSTATSLDGLFAPRIRGKLKLEVYIDDCQYSPSFTNRTQNFTCIYLSLADIPYHLRTKRDEIDIYMLVNKAKLDELKLDDVNFALFSLLRSEIETINQNGGLQLISSTGVQFNINVTISTVLGDNAAIYPFIGFSKSFGNNAYRCRFCFAVGRSREGGKEDDIQNSLTFRQLITSSEEADQLLNRRSTFVFESFQGIDRWNISPPDLMHDLSEGVIQNIIELIFTSISAKYKLNPSSGRAWLSDNRDLISKSVENFSFYEGQPCLRVPAGQSSFKLSGTALQKTEVLLKMEAIFSNILDPEWPEFKLYKATREFVLLSFSPVFTANEIRKFRPLASKMIDLCTSIQPEFTVFCKLHHLCHYGDLIERFGPLHVYSTYRYERVHQFRKKVCRSSKNFINLAATINSKNQRHRAYFLEKSDYYSADLFPTEPRTPANPLVNNIPENCISLPSSKRPFPLNKCVLRKLKTRRDLYFLPTEFRKEPESQTVYCFGSLLVKKTATINDRLTFVKLNDTLFELEISRRDKFIKLSDLHYSNDFYFYHNSKMYLLEWIL